MPDIQQEKEKTFEEACGEALRRKSLYTKEWTGSLPSDPGIMMLEHLTAFSLIQQREMNGFPERVQEKWLKLQGFTRRQGKSARVLLQTEKGGGAVYLPAHQKLTAGDCCFETVQEIRQAGGKLQKVFGADGAGIPQEIPELSRGNPLSAWIFGKQPKAGAAVWLLFDGPPGAPKETVRLWVTAEEYFPRNPSRPGWELCFADAEWTCLTEEGYADVACRDGTDCFCHSGEILLTLPEASLAAEKLGEETGYAIRCVLTRAEYDVPPLITGIDGPVFEVYEKDTKVVSFLFEREEPVRLPAVFPDESFRDYYAEREKGTGEYTACSGNDFPGSGRIKVVCYSKEAAVHRDLGILYGYDRQEIDVSMPGTLAEESLEVMEKSEEAVYRFYRPGEQAAGALVYEYDSLKKCIRILRQSGHEGSRLFLSSCASFRGEKGNIRKGNLFFPLSGDPEYGDACFINPVSGAGGCDEENLEQVRQRWMQSFRMPQAAVTAEDYDELVKHIPGLCIHKVKTFAETGSAGERAVTVCVKPYGINQYPELIHNCQRQIVRYLEERKMLHTKVTVLGPAYIPVHVQADILVQAQYGDCRGEIEELVKQKLDYVNGEQAFGETVSFMDLFYGIEQLPCVLQVYSLRLYPESSAKWGQIRQGAPGEDIRLPQNGLCTCGRISLRLRKKSIV